jgi:argininosuccinate lyase
MEDTGRIKRGLNSLAQQIVYGDSADAAITTELGVMTRIDLAHVVMLMETGIINKETAIMLLRHIDELRASDFAPLRGRPTPRGIYLLYEDYLIGTLGADVGGTLQTARSRNDLNATVLKLRLRDAWIDVFREGLRLQYVLMRRASEFRHVTMPAYTHFQPAVPITYGHYLLGVAVALQRDIRSIRDAAAGLETSPLGAGAAGGTSLPIDVARTAALLGFDAGPLHSLDAVASRDLVLRLLASVSIFGVTLSRLATDLLLWLTDEFRLLTLPDELVGSSSMMPQKRNPFLLEHVQGRSMAALGEFVAATSASHATSFTNSIAVGTEAAHHVWAGLAHVREAAALARLVVAGARPAPFRMLLRAQQGFTAATELSNRLVTREGISFRTAHRRVGELINAIEAAQAGSQGDAGLDGSPPPAWPSDLDPAVVAETSVYGGGPGPASFARAAGEVRAAWHEQLHYLRAKLRAWRCAEAALDTTVSRIVAEGSR